jgi:hypothetical protein
MSGIDAFQQLIKTVTDEIGERPLNSDLQALLNERFPVGGDTYEQLAQACRQGREEGWMCQYEHGGLRYGRVIKPGPALNGFSVDVVDMQDIAGPHHQHPNGEIDLIMPLESDARFDNHPAGWLVYGPGSQHSPTVTQGRALVLYLLPEGKIDFTRN